MANSTEEYLDSLLRSFTEEINPPAAAAADIAETPENIGDQYVPQINDTASESGLISDTEIADFSEGITDDISAGFSENNSDSIPESFPDFNPNDISADTVNDSSNEIFADIPAEPGNDIPIDIPTDIPNDIPADIMPDLTSDISENITDEIVSDFDTGNFSLPDEMQDIHIDETDIPVEEIDIPADETDIPAYEADFPADNEDMPVDDTDITIDDTDMPVDDMDIPSDGTDIHEPKSILDDIFAGSDASDDDIVDDNYDGNVLDDLFKSDDDQTPDLDNGPDFSDLPAGAAEDMGDAGEKSGPEDEEISSLLDSIGALDEKFAQLDDNSPDAEELNSDFSGLSMNQSDIDALLNQASSDSVTDDGPAGNDLSGSDDLDLGDLLNSLGSDDAELSEIGDLLSKDENAELVEPRPSLEDGSNYDIESLLEDDSEENDDDSSNGKKGKKKKNKKEKKNKKSRDGKDGDDGEKKPGFFKRLLMLFFEEDPENDPAAFEQTAVEIAAEGALENDEILKELEEGPKPKKEKKEKKKKEKKKKDPKPKKEKPPKKPKEKKVKPPKEPEPPLKKLPKKKIIVIALFMITLGIAIIFVGVYYPDLQDISKAKKYFETKNYEKTYEYLIGHELSDDDAVLYEKTVILLKLKRQNDSYMNYMKLGMKPEALNALVQGIDAMDKYAEKANELGILDEYVNLSASLINNLQNTFGVSVDQAREWLDMEGTKDYTKALYDYLGLTPESDENAEKQFFSPDISIIVQEERADDSDN